MSDIIKRLTTTQEENVITYKMAYGKVKNKKVELTLEKYIKINKGWWVKICEASSIIGHSNYFMSKFFANIHFNKVVKKYNLKVIE